MVVALGALVGCSSTGTSNTDGGADRPAKTDGGAGHGGAGGKAGTNGVAGTSGGGNGGAKATGGNGGGAGGPAGANGAAGASGAAGTTGTAGTSGAAGTTGTAGTSGAAGTTGAAGTSGAAGDDGAAGATGAAGDDGAAGTTGAAGDDGTAGAGGTTVVVTPGDSVLMHHNHLNRDGVYVQPLLTKTAAAGLQQDTTFVASFVGNVYAQPLYVDNGPSGTDLVILATQADTVYAFDASSGQQVWQTTVGTPVPLGALPCGDIDPFGVTSTPVIDLASRTLFVGAMTTPDAGSTIAYEIFALSIDDGSVRPGWPVDMASTVTSGSTTFTPSVQGQRAALALVNGILYVPFGGLGGDCGDYRGWVVAIPIADPSVVQAWSTTARGGGIWGPGGIASDGSNIYVTTGNTFGVTDWAGGEAIVQFPASLPLSTDPAYWAPPNWPGLDLADLDVGSAGPIVFDLPGATPSHLVVALGKDGNAFLEDANNLGGVADPLAQILASTGSSGAHAVYSTDSATYLAFRGASQSCSGDLITLKIIPGSPPTFGGSWCATATGGGSPIVTTTDGRSDAIVWVVGGEGNELLQGFDGDTGDTIFAGGATPIPGVRHFTVPIAAKGRIFVAADNVVFAFTP